MTKHNYYKLLEDYNSIIETKQYNSMYCLQSDLDQMKRTLLLNIKKFKINSEIELCNGQLSLYETERVEHNIGKLSEIIQLIHEEKPIPKDVYDKTYVYSYMTIYGIPLPFIFALFIIGMCLIAFM